jgi:hypothetical protein
MVRRLMEAIRPAIKVRCSPSLLDREAPRDSHAARGFLLFAALHTSQNISP